MKTNLIRLNMNLPEDIIIKIDAYGNEHGFNRTNAVIDLLNKGFEYDSTLTNVVKELKKINKNIAKK